MAKFYGPIGYGIMKETVAGVMKEQIVERFYYGDLIRNNRGLKSSTQLNDNLNISNDISIVSDPFANENFHAIRYVEFMGSQWKVSNVEVLYPRLILTVGDLYNG